MTRPRVGALLVVVVVVAAVWPSPAFAHAFLEQTTPAAGARVDRAPQRVLLRFSEPVTVSGDGLELRTADGRAVALRASAAEGGSILLGQPLRPLAGGVYQVRWQILSDDGHYETGLFSFGVGASAAPVPTASTGTPVARELVVGRLLLYLGLAACLGRVVTRRHLRLSATLPATIALGALAAIAGCVLMIASLTSASADTPLWQGLAHLGDVTSTRAGTALALLAVALVALTIMLFRFPASERMILVIGGIAVVLVALAGHSASAALVPLTVTADALHVAAALTWTGALVELAALAARGRLNRQLLHRFAPLGAVATTLLAASGVTLAAVEVGNLAALTDTAYGHTVILKSALFAGALVLVACNRYIAARAQAQLSAPLVLETAVLAMLLGAAAVLVNVPPAADSSTPPSERSAALVTQSGLLRSEPGHVRR